MLPNLAESTSSWSCITVILSICWLWTSLRPSILSKMIWNASRGGADEVEALLLLALLLDVEVCPIASASVSIGSPSSCSAPSSSTSPKRCTYIYMMVCLLIAEGVGIRLRSWGIGTPFAPKIHMRRLGKTNFTREVVLVSSIIVLNIWELISMNVFSLSSIRKMALALLIVVSFFTRYRLFIMMMVRYLMSTRKAVVLRHFPSLCPPIRFWTVYNDNILSL